MMIKKHTHNQIIIAMTIGLTSNMVLADTKVRLRPNNNYVIEDRASGVDKFVVNNTTGATTGGGTSSDNARTSTGISAGENAIGDVLDPIQDQDAATKKYVDDAIANI